MLNYKNININQYFTNIFSGNGLHIENTPSWLPKAIFSRTQTDLIATSPEGEQVVFIDYFTNFDLPNIQTENGLLLKGSLLKTLGRSVSQRSVCSSGR